MTEFFTSQGSFTVGCNYWASHAGTAMWADWKPEVVEADFRQLSENGLQVLRVFPLWPDFQPIHQLYTGGGQPQEIRLVTTPGSQPIPLPDDNLGRAGLSQEMMEHFKQFADLAENYHLKLLVGLLTGWMSGRLFIPPALEGRNVITDPVALMWEVHFVRGFVRYFKDHPAVLAWDLGNECNVMAPVPNHEAAWLWTAAITGAIRREDRTRPIVSGMHSLDEPDANGNWRIQDQAELVDILTTHPYPYWTPHCAQEPINTIRPLLHSSAQTRWYGDVGKTTAFTEEIGNLGPIMSNDQLSADFLRTVLLSLWAHDCRGLLWWCAYDQAHLTHPPYDWAAFERELGLFQVDPAGPNRPKRVASELKDFRGFLDHLPFKTLPLRVVDAVCILTHHQEQWAAAYSSFILAKQAGIDIEFQYTDQPLKKAHTYLVPSASGGDSMPHHFWEALLEEVAQGASLYVSHKDCFLSPFDEVFGLQVISRQHRKEASASLHFMKINSASVEIPALIRLNLKAVKAEVLIQEADGNPVFTRAQYGRGKAYFLSVPIETGLIDSPGAFDQPIEQPLWWIYRQICQSQATERVVLKQDPLIGITEHPLAKDRRVVVAINYSPEAINASIQIAPGWQFESVLRGGSPKDQSGTWQCPIPANDGLVFTLRGPA